MENSDLPTSLKEELEEIEASPYLSASYKRNKLQKYVIRTILAFILFIVFWEYEWVRWSLWFYVPLNLLGLGSIYLMPYLVGKKLAKVREKVNALPNDLIVKGDTKAAENE
ncbi:MAG: hypothetical protein AAF694_07890 [Bacteroidota bacterium]